MSHEVIIEDGGVFGTQGMNVEKGILISASSGASKPASKDPLINPDIDGTNGEWQNWGTDNLWPTRIRKQLEKSTVAIPLIFKSVCAMFGMGVRYWTESIEDGQLKKSFDPIESIEEFFLNNDVNNIALERMMDFKFFNNMFQEFIFSENGQNIVETYHLEAEFCRLSIQDTTSHEHKLIGYFGDWENVSADKVIKIENCYFRKLSSTKIKEKFAKKGKLSVHTKFPMPGRPIYGVPPHVALYRTNGWLDYSNEIPVILNSMIQNGMNIKYHITIPADYWQTVYPDWASFSEEKQKVKRKEKITEISDFLSGSENVHKSFITEVAIDQLTKKPLAGWEIKVINDKSSLDKEIFSSQESDAHIARALNIDPSLAGLQPQGGKMGAGSGSDKRTSFMNAISMSHAEELYVLEFLEVVKKINEWPSNVRFGFMHQVPTTLNENKAGIEETI